MITPLENQNPCILNNNLLESMPRTQGKQKLSKIKLYAKLALRIILSVLILLTPITISYPYLPKAIVYSWFRELGKLSLEHDTRDLYEMDGEHFIVRFHAKDEDMASLVLNTVEKAYGPVTRDFNYQPQDGKIPIIIYPTRESLGRSFGWPANESAMGVYYSGAIRVLSPKEWVAAKNQEMFVKTFESSGPMAHEFTHLVVDYLTRGNYPRWFTEGLAQYEEYKLTGFKFTEKEGNLNQQLYNLNDMDRNFDNLPNQSLAYRQSLVAVKYILNNYGQKGLTEILQYLAKGKSMNQSLKLALGVSLDQFNSNYDKWIKDNINALQK